MISDSTIESIRKNVPIADIVSETVKLKQSGSNMSGLCPFHGEKTASFNVNTSENYYHCFGCGASGNVITFVMQTQGLTFPEAVEYLAGRYNIAVEYTGKKEKRRGPGSTDLYKVNALAYEFFRNNLEKASKEIKDYVANRGINQELVSNFGLGYAQDNWDSLYNFLRTRKVPDNLIFLSALAKQNSAGKIYDTFRSRVIFPIWIDNKRIAGFGGRVTRKEDQPKYLNSPETPVYQKSKILYGLPHAMAAIKETRSVYLVEGYMDVIGLNKVGIKNVVATCGTALTEQHVKKLSHLVNKVVLLFDGDSAGKAAAAKSFKQMLNLEADVEALFLPDNMDPDDIANQHGQEAANYLNSLETKSLLSCYLEQKFENLKVDSIDQLGAVSKSKLADELIDIINKAQNKFVQAELVKEGSFLLKVNQNELFRKRKVENQYADIEVSESEEEPSDKAIEQLDLLNRCVLQAAILNKEKLAKEIIANPDFSEILEPATLNFITELDKIVASEDGLSQKKQKVVELLNSFHSSWARFWKEAHQIVEDPLVKTDSLYEQCQKEAKKIKLLKTIKKLDEQAKFEADSERKMGLLQQKLELNRELNKLQSNLEILAA